MARGGSGGRSYSRTAPRRAPAPAPVRQAPPPAPVQSGGSILGSIGTTIAEGFAFGGGSAIAHRVVDYFIGPRTIEVQASVVPKSVQVSVVPNSDACSMQTKAFQDCVNNFGSDISKCQTYMDRLSQCKNNSYQSSG